MKRSLFAFLFSICFVPAFSQGTSVDGSVSPTSTTFNRPNPGTPPPSLSGTDVHFTVLTVTVPPPGGVIRFTIASEWDNFVVLYDVNGFNPSDPLTNSLLAVDDYYGVDNSTSGFDYNFAAGGKYYLVVCAFKPLASGAFTVTTNKPVVLPLKLLSFTAAKAGSKMNLLKWSSAEEVNLDSYQVQLSTDGTTFNDLANASIAAKNSALTTSYSYTDMGPASGNNYYRLKIKEKTGLVAYSAIAVVRNENTSLVSLKLYPNPASDFLQIESKTTPNTRAAISVINALGTVVLQGQYSFNSVGKLSVDIKKLPVGKYFVKTATDTDMLTISFLKN